MDSRAISAIILAAASARAEGDSTTVIRGRVVTRRSYPCLEPALPVERVAVSGMTPGIRLHDHAGRGLDRAEIRESAQRLPRQQGASPARRSA
jgi:hypothetical protein